MAISLPYPCRSGRRRCSRCFRADLRHKSGARVKVLSTNWQTVSLMTPQDGGYRAFITELHARMQPPEARRR